LMPDYGTKQIIGLSLPTSDFHDDTMIAYPAQQAMAKRAGVTIAEVPGSHAIYVCNPSAIAALIEQAAGGVK
jgi:hypothetical protein